MRRDVIAHMAFAHEPVGPCRPPDLSRSPPAPTREGCPASGAAASVGGRGFAAGASGVHIGQVCPRTVIAPHARRQKPAVVQSEGREHCSLSPESPDFPQERVQAPEIAVVRLQSATCLAPTSSAPQPSPRLSKDGLGSSLCPRRGPAALFSTATTRSIPRTRSSAPGSSMASHKLVPALAESLQAPPRRDFTFYLVLALAVAPIWSIVPLSWAFVVYALHAGLVWSFSWKGWCLFALALCEVRPSDRAAVIAPYLTPRVRRCSLACTTTTSRLSSRARAPMAPATFATSGPSSIVFSSLVSLPYQKTVSTKSPSMSTGQEAPRNPSPPWNLTIRGP